MGLTFSEKVISKKLKRTVYAGENVVVNVDVAMATDTTAFLAIKAFKEMGGKRVWDSRKVVFIIDHATPCPNERIANLHKYIREFAQEQKTVFYDQNTGVCHQVMLENNLVKEGYVAIGADSHTCTYGAVGAFAAGVGSTDLGAVLLTGKTWLRVPETIKIILNGKLPDGVSGKDVILHIIGDVKSDGATYMAVEFDGDGFASLSNEDAITICNMTVEMGAKIGVFVPSLTNPELIPDFDATYKEVKVYNAEEIVPMLSCPHSVDNVRSVKDLEGKKVDLVYLGSCTNARLGDIAVAAKILRGKKIPSGIRMIISPASSQVLKKAIEMGYVTQLIDAGATFITPGCGLCVGTLGGVPADGEVVVSTTNRNFLGRMGNNKAFIYLSSPATAAATALRGKITDPREVL